jgi:hypothetical protein
LVDRWSYISRQKEIIDLPACNSSGAAAVLEGQVRDLLLILLALKEEKLATIKYLFAQIK